MILNNFGKLAYVHGHYDQAKDLYHQSLAIRQKLGNQSGIASSLYDLGELAYLQGNYERATDSYQQSLTIAQKLGNQVIITQNLMGLGWVEFKQRPGQTQSVHWFSQALKTAHMTGIAPLILWAVVGFAGYLTQQGLAERAAKVVGLVQQHPAQDDVVHESFNQVMPLLEAALSPDDLAVALECGKSLDLDTVVQELLDEFGGNADPQV